MHISELDFELPPELVATEPLGHRDDSRLLYVDRTAGTYVDRRFSDLHRILDRTDVLVLNNTKVFPARLLGTSDTGAAVEIFLVKEVAENTWDALARPARRLPPGRSIVFGDGFSGQIIQRDGEGHVIVSLQVRGSITEAIERFGRTPLPPYIKRERDAPDRDRQRYQTVYASRSGAIAAPTAGLHFTPRVLEELREKGIQVIEITLHVGYGTFEPVKVEKLNDHRVQPERYELNEDAAAKLAKARSEGRRIIAVGTTTTRTLETVIGRTGEFRASSGDADLTILPGYEFRAIDGLLTNFHLPKSSLLALVSAFGGHKLIMNAYEYAVRSRYRFYSYGDCMLIV